MIPSDWLLWYENQRLIWYLHSLRRQFIAASASLRNTIHPNGSTKASLIILITTGHIFTYNYTCIWKCILKYICVKVTSFAEILVKVYKGGQIWELTIPIIKVIRVVLNSQVHASITKWCIVLMYFWYRKYPARNCCLSTTTRETC